MELYVASNNNTAQTFDELTDRFIEECFVEDDEIILIALQLLIARLLKLQRNWPEDIFAFADYVDAKYDSISAANKRKKRPMAKDILEEFLNRQEEEFEMLLQSNG